MEFLNKCIKFLSSALCLPCPTKLQMAVLAGMVGTSVSLYLLRIYMNGGRCMNTNRLDGKTVVITGSNSGIGKVTAIELASRGARVILACRNMEKGLAALKEIKEKSGSENVILMQLDLASKHSIEEFAHIFLAQEEHLHVLINNAGGFSYKKEKTEDGFEITMGVNYMGHFYLTKLLLDQPKKSAPSRIINVSSLAHKYCLKDFIDDLNMVNVEYTPFYAYANSKAANVMHAFELSRLLKDTGVTAYSLHPGSVAVETHKPKSTILRVSY